LGQGAAEFLGHDPPDERLKRRHEDGGDGVVRGRRGRTQRLEHVCGVGQSLAGPEVVERSAEGLGDLGELVGGGREPRLVLGDHLRRRLHELSERFAREPGPDPFLADPASYGPCGLGALLFGHLA